MSAVLVLSATAELGAQQSRPLIPPPEFAVDQWTTEDGLPQNSVNAIVQTPDGYLWIGTFGGLARFDGSAFSRVERTDSAGRPVVDRILSLATTPDGGLWIGTENGLLRRSAAGAYETYATGEGLTHGEVQTLHTDRRGVLWFGTYKGDLNWYADGKLGRFDSVDGTPLGLVESIVEGADGTLWVNVFGGRVLVLPGGDPAARHWWLSPIEGESRLLLEDSGGSRWMGLRLGAARVSGTGVRRFKGPANPSVIVEDQESGYWVGTINDGLFFISPDGSGPPVRRYALPNGRQEFRVRAAHMDSDGNLWLGTNANGLLRTRRNLFTTYTRAHGLSHDVVTAIFGDAAGTLWVATNCGGVNEIDPSRRTVRTLNPRSRADPDGDPCVFSLGRGPTGSVVQGSYGGGVSELPTTGELRVQLPLELADSVVLALLTSRDGTLWVGTRTGGLAEVRDGSVRHIYTTTDGLPHDGVRAIYESRDGALWIGTLGGLSRLADGQLTTYTTRDGLSVSHVRAIHEDDEGTFWIGTYGGGINHFRDGVFSAITRRDGLADDVISAIVEDDAGYFWLSGNRGIYRVARRELVDFVGGRLERVHSVLYGRGDGLRNPETNGGFQPAAWKDPRGHLWFPTVEGVAVVDPARSRRVEAAPSARVEGVTIDGESQPLEEVAMRGEGRPNVEFRYAGLSLSAPEHVTFRYRLEGFDAGWVEAGRRRVAYYPRLPAGAYRFTVRAANRDGVWGKPSSTELRVVPPFWSSKWARLTGGLGLMLLLAGFVRRRDGAARREREATDQFSRRLIESQEHERLRLAAELHDGLGQDLMIVRNRALLALRSAGMEPEVRQQIDHICDVVSGALESIRELVHDLTPHQLRHLGLSSALHAMAEALAATSGIDLDTRIEEIDGLMPEESEINLYRIVQEALNNVVRHSGARTASLRVWQDGAEIHLAVRDRGRGFRSERAAHHHGDGGFGLSGMAERARILGGTLRVRSAPGRGTRVELSVPASAMSGT